MKGNKLDTLAERLSQENVSHLYRGEDYKELFFVKQRYISTGSQELDRLFDYGIEPYKIYEIYGPAGTGKTILLHQIVANSFEENMLGYSYYMDGEGNFNPELLLRLLEKKGKREHIKHVRYSRVKGASHLSMLINKILEKKREEDVNVVVIDNLTEIIRAEVNRRDPRAIHSYTRKLLLELHNIKEELAIPIVLTVRIYGVLHDVFAEAYEPYGGLAQSSMVNKLISLTKETDFFRAIDPYGLKPTALFKISEEGISDI
jgi:RecA/RadA recombinase